MAHNNEMKIAAREARNQRLVARITKRHKRLLERAAALEGQSVGGFMIAHACRAAEELVSKHEIIELNDAQSRRLVEAMFRSPREIPAALKKASDLYKKAVTNSLK
jgi:uncharacterized protein (DUF1778 family)